MNEKEMILKQNLDVLVLKYIGTIKFAFYSLEQIQTAHWGAIMFGSWADVVSKRRPDSLKNSVVQLFKRDFESA